MIKDGVFNIGKQGSAEKRGEENQAFAFLERTEDLASLA